MKNWFQGLKFKSNIYAALILRLLIVMFIFSLCRVGFYLFNLSYFPDISLAYFFKIMAGGLRFDLTAVLYTNMLLIVLMILPFKFRFSNGYQKTLNWIFYISNSAAIVANVADFVYFRFTGRRTTADVFEQFQNETNLPSLFLRFAWDYWYAVIIIIGFVGLMVWLYKKVKIEGPQLVNKVMFYSSGTLLIPGIIYMFIIGVRGGAYHHIRPITLNDAGQYVENPRDVILVLNTPFALYRTLGKTKIKKVNFYKTEQELSAVFSPFHESKDTTQMSKLNVVVIILESFSKEFIGFFNQHRENGTYKGYTPFLDSLLQHSRSYQYSFANGRKSIDALPSVIASIPSMGVPYVLTPYSGNRINSLGSLLGKEGYESAFFHGAPNGSMGFEAFMNVAGINKYFGMTEYGNDEDFDNWWGIWDEKFMGFVADEQNKLKEPFCSIFFSVSSHHPYIIPEIYESKFKGGKIPILKCIQYTDNALRKYFQKISKAPWFKNTLFVISADHVSSHVLFDDGRAAPGMFSIPVFFYRPDGSLSGKDETTIVQQVDVMPTVLGYLNYNKPYVAFGRDLLNDTTQSYAWNYEAGVYQFYQKDYLLQFDGKKSIALYKFREDNMLKKNLIMQESAIVVEMEKKLKAIIQQYNNRMADNNLTLSSNTLPSATGN